MSSTWSSPVGDAVSAGHQFTPVVCFAFAHEHVQLLSLRPATSSSRVKKRLLHYLLQWSLSYNTNYLDGMKLVTSRAGWLHAGHIRDLIKRFSVGYSQVIVVFIVPADRYELVSCQ
jgi:hypothetical protein